MTTITELEEQLTALKEQHYRNDCSDNAYFISGRAGEMKTAIREAQEALVSARAENERRCCRELGIDKLPWKGWPEAAE